ncbi:MAG: hypothetical protein ACAI25_06480, partial [Planctomycetota bacterium]
MSIATCGNCGAAWNVAGITGVPSVGCQRCGAQIPLPAAGPPPAWQPGPMLSGEGIVANPADPGTPIGENAIPCGHCGTVLDAAGLPVGVGLRCGRCGGVFPRPSAQQVMAALGQPAYAPPPQQQYQQQQYQQPPHQQPQFQQQQAPQMSSQQQAASRSMETSGELELSLKNTTRCPGCGKEYYDEELPEPDEKRQLRCKRCKKVMKDLSEEEEEEEEEEEAGAEEDEEEDERPAKKKPLMDRRRGSGGGGGGKSKGKKAKKKVEEEAPKTVILDEKFKSDFYASTRAGDADKAMKKCLDLVGGREMQAKQIFDHLFGIAKKKGWVGSPQRPVPTPGPQPARPGPGQPPPRPQGAPMPPPQQRPMPAGSSGNYAPLPYQQPAIPPGVQAELPPGLIEVTPIITPAPG